MIIKDYIKRLCGVGSVLALMLFMACSEAQEHTAPAVNPEDSVSMMTTYGVNTLISDSGVIKYRIVTERWDVNTVRQPSRWEFMKGAETPLETAWTREYPQYQRTYIYQRGTLLGRTQP